jgi:hypothetical protein
MTGEPTFFELGVPDGSKASRFYQELFGWEVDPMGGDNFMLRTPNTQIGLHPNDDSRILEVFFSVADLEAAVKRVEELGGTAQKARHGGEFGRFVECSDDQGVKFGLHELAS